MLREIMDQSCYEETSTDCYCEVSVDDEFHSGAICSCNYDDRAMWKTKNDAIITERLRNSIDSGGAYICNECYHSLADMIMVTTRSRATRKRLRLPSKPPRIRRIPA
jgi:uncharacterized protein YlaI